MIGATVLRALVLTAAFSAGLTPVTCLSENSNRLPTKATKEPPELLSLLRQKKGYFVCKVHPDHAGWDEL